MDKIKDIQIQKQFNHQLKRTELDGFTCLYQYNFKTNQWLESIDNYEYFGIEHSDIKQKVIDSLVNEFRIILNDAIFKENK